MSVVILCCYTTAGLPGKIPGMWWDTGNVQMIHWSCFSCLRIFRHIHSRTLLNCNLIRWVKSSHLSSCSQRAAVANLHTFGVSAVRSQVNPSVFLLWMNMLLHPSGWECIAMAAWNQAQAGTAVIILHRRREQLITVLLWRLQPVEQVLFINKSCNSWSPFPVCGLWWTAASEAH